MDKMTKIKEYFSAIETSKEHNGYFCSVVEALTVVILGSLCGLRNVNQIHQWATDSRVSDVLARCFHIRNVPCCYWLLCLLKIIKPASLNKCLMHWVQSFLTNGVKELTLSFDGKTIRSTGKMDKYENPLHIISAHIAEIGITIASQKLDDKSNQIPAMRKLIEFLNIEGCIVVADALHCQKETAAVIIESKADYLLSVKGNQPTLKEDIEDYIQNNELRKCMETSQTIEQNSSRIESRTAFISHDTSWLNDLGWSNLSCIGAIHTQFNYKGKTTSEWHYYISSRKLSAETLLKHARLEWSVESMHWLLDVHFGEDFCRIEDENIQQTLNMVRKTALNNIKLYKQATKSKLPLSKIMFSCLLAPEKLLDVFIVGEN